MTEGSVETEKRESSPAIMHFGGYGTVVGIAIAEGLTVAPGPSLILTLSFMAGFLCLLFLMFRRFRRSGKAWFAVLSSAQTALAVGVMATGSSPLLGGVLFFVLCAVVARKLSLAASLSLDGLASLTLYCCLLARGRGGEWAADVLPFGLGVFAVSALSLTLRRAQDSRAESQRLLDELNEAHGRLRELAVLEERQRLAREMHDAVGHRLTASAMLLEGAARLIPTEPDRAVRLVETSRDQVREGLAELRTAVSALREDGSGRLPLAGILGAMVDVFGQSAEAKVSLHVQEGLPEPDTERKLVLTRSAQEALTNAQKHSGASRVELRLGFDGEAYELECRDDGRGPPAVDAPPIPGAASGFGLGNLRARAAAFGGSVELRPAEGGGALLRLRLPDPSMKEGEIGGGS
jgi:signal transduction histidine kinase